MSEIPIPPAVTLYWQEERIKELEAEVELLRAAEQDKAKQIPPLLELIEQLRTVLAACQKALKEMQAQRDRAREGKR